MVEIRSRHGEKCILMEGRTGSRKYGTCQKIAPILLPLHVIKMV